MDCLELAVRTRTSVLDYRFVGRVEERWWEDRYGRWTDFSRPSLIVEPSRFFLGGIPSFARRDSKGAVIHYAIVGQLRGDARGAGEIVSALCAGFDFKNGVQAIANALDLIEEEKWVAAIQGDARAKAFALECVSESCASLKRPEVDTPQLQHWYAGPAPKNLALLAKTGSEVFGSPPGAGVAACLNLASEQEVAEIGRGCHVVGLVVPGGPDGPKRLAPRLSRGAATVAIAIILVLMLVLLYRGIWSSGPGSKERTPDLQLHRSSALKK